MITTANSFL